MPVSEAMPLIGPIVAAWLTVLVTKFLEELYKQAMSQAAKSAIAWFAGIARDYRRQPAASSQERVMQQIVADLEGAGLPHEQATRLAAELWQKSQTLTKSLLVN